MYLCPPLSTTLTEPGQESPKTSALPSTVEEGSSPKNFLWGNLREPLPSNPPSNNLRAADWLLHKNTGSLHYDAATLVYFLFLNLLWTLLEGGLALGVIQSRTATDCLDIVVFIVYKNYTFDTNLHCCLVDAFSILLCALLMCYLLVKSM